MVGKVQKITAKGIILDQGSDACHATSDCSLGRGDQEKK